MVRKVEDVLKISQIAFNKHKMSAVKKAENLAQEIHEEELDLTTRFIKLAVNTPQARTYKFIPGHLEKIGDNLEHILHSIRKKVDEKILFTEKAVVEINGLFEETETLLNHIRDLIVTGNAVLAREVEQLTDEIVKIATEYATFHEDRLIEGICLPVALSLSIHILDAIKGIAWHARKIAGSFS
jgi:Na+/phosphate symporter